MFKVSVIIPIYNAEMYIKDAVDSAIVLDGVGEVILIDDGSQDNSIEICKNLENKYSIVKFYQHPDKGNHGPSQSRNLGITKAECQYISFLDADDIYLPNRFDSEKFLFNELSDVEVVYGCSHTIFMSKEGENKYYANEQSHIYTLSERIAPENLFRALLFYSYGRLHTSAITIKKNAFEKTGIFNTSLKWAEDTELWLKLALKTKMVGGIIDVPISFRRIHDNNVVHQNDKAQHYKIKMYQSLFKWSLKKKCSFSVTNDIFNAYKIYMFQKYPSTNEKKVFWGLVRSYKSIIVHSFFYKKLKLLYFG